MADQDSFSAREPASRGARGFAQQLERDGRERLEIGKASAADRIDAVAGAVDAAAARLQPDEPSVATYVGRLAGSMSGFATRLREGSLEDLLAQARDLAQRQPALFLSGGFLLGVALARFLKASSHEEDSSDTYGGEPRQPE